MSRNLVIAILVMTGVQAAARAQRAWDPCFNNDPKLVISNCAAFIEANAGGDPSVTAGPLTWAFVHRGDAYSAEGEFDRAIADYGEAIKRSPNFNIAFNNRALAYGAKGDYDRAIQDLTEAIGIKAGYITNSFDPFPFDVEAAFSNRGNAYLEKKEYDRAIQDFNEAIRLKSNDADAYCKRGIVYNAMRDFDRAIADFNASLQLNPKDAQALYRRGLAKRNKDADGAQTDIAAAEGIDAGIAGKVGGKSVPVVPIEVFKPNSQSVASCDVLPKGASAIARVPSYVDEPIEQLRTSVPGLRGIKLEAGQDASEGTAAGPGQDKTAQILSQTGAAIADLLHRMPNLMAKEVVKQPDVAPSGNSPPLIGDGRSAASQYAGVSMATQYKTSVYSYRIVRKQKPSGDPAFDELRLDQHGRPIDYSSQNASRPLSVGLATLWLLFSPNHLHESHFRYLGEQKIGNREAYVVAFAQIPIENHLHTVIESPYGHCSSSLQGVAWIDESTFQMVRMQTDLLSPLPAIRLNQLRAVLNFGAAKIRERNLTLWLPTDVENTWKTASGTGEESHTYSNYKLFEATMKIVQVGDSPPP